MSAKGTGLTAEGDFPPQTIDSDQTFMNARISWTAYISKNGTAGFLGKDSVPWIRWGKEKKL